MRNSMEIIHDFPCSVKHIKKNCPGMMKPDSSILRQFFFTLILIRNSFFGILGFFLKQ